MSGALGFTDAQRARIVLEYLKPGTESRTGRGNAMQISPKGPPPETAHLAMVFDEGFFPSAITREELFDVQAVRDRLDEIANS